MLSDKINFKKLSKDKIVFIAISLIALLFLVVQVTMPTKITILNQYTKEPLEGVDVCYKYAGFGGHELRTLIYKCGNTNEKGQFTLPFYVGIRPFWHIMDTDIWIEKRHHSFSRGTKDAEYFVIPKIENLEECKAIKNQEFRQECFDKNIMKFTDLTNDTSICNFSPSNKNDCISKIALNKLDYNVCKEIAEDKLREDCILEIAKKEKNYDKCRELRILSKECEEHFYCGEKDSVCFSSYGNFTRAEITSIIQRGNIELCDNLPSLPKQFCYFQFAIDTLNPNYCESLNYTWTEGNGAYYDEDLQGQCYLSLAIYTNNEQLCGNSPPDSKIRCVEQIRIQKSIINVTKTVKMRELGWQRADPPVTHLINDGTVYVNASDYTCYRLGVIIPGEHCHSRRPDYR